MTDEPMSRLGVPLLSAQQVADYFGCTLNTVRRKLHAKELPGVKVGKEWKVPVPVLEQWLVDQCAYIEDPAPQTGGSRLTGTLAARLAQKIKLRQRNSGKPSPSEPGDSTSSETEPPVAGMRRLSAT